MITSQNRGDHVIHHSLADSRNSDCELGLHQLGLFPGESRPGESRGIDQFFIPRSPGKILKIPRGKTNCF